VTIAVAPRMRTENPWGVSIAAGLPALLIALAMPLIVDGEAIGFAFAPLVLLVIIAAAARGALVGATAVVVAIVLGGAAAWVTGLPIWPFAVASAILAGGAFFSWALARGRWPVWSAVPGLILIVLALLSGLADTLEGQLVAVLAVVALALLAFLTGPWALRDSVRTTRLGEVGALLMLLILGGVAYGGSAAVESRLGPPLQLSLLGISDPVDSPDGSPPDPFVYAARWQLEPTQTEVELFTIVTGPQAPANRPIWASFNRYNGFGWYSAATIGVPGDAITVSEEPDGSRADGRTRVDIGLALPGQWVPTPQEVTQVLGAVATRVDAESSTVTALSSPVDQAFAINYRVPVASEAELEATTPLLIDDIDPAVLIPGALPAAMQDLADAIAEEAGDDTWRRLLLLARFLRENRFTPAPPTVLADGTPDRSYAGLVQVLAEGEGLQEQFAAIWALVGRSWGIPTRLVIGWVPPVGAEQAGGDQVATTTVRGIDTGVWAQARLTGLGWVTFQPSPQDRDAGRPAVERPLTPEEVPEPDRKPDVDPTPPGPSPDGGGDENREQDISTESSLGSILIAVIGVIVLVGILLGGWLVLAATLRRRVRRRLEATAPERAVANAVQWVRALLREARMPLPGSWAPAALPVETPDLPDAVSASLQEFAMAAAPLRFAGGMVSEHDANEMWRRVDALDEQILAAGGRRGRWRRRFTLPPGLRYDRDRTPTRSTEPA